MSDQIFLVICSPVHITEEQSKVANHFYLNNVPSIKEHYISYTVQYSCTFGIFIYSTQEVVQVALTDFMFA